MMDTVRTFSKIVAAGGLSAGDNEFFFEVESGQEWEILGGYIQILYGGAATNYQHVEMSIKSDQPASQGNVIMRKLICPWIANVKYNVSFGPTESDYNGENIALSAALTARTRTVSVSPVVLRQGYSVQFNVKNVIAADNDAVNINLTVRIRMV